MTWPKTHLPYTTLFRFMNVADTVSSVYKWIHVALALVVLTEWAEKKKEEEEEEKDRFRMSRKVNYIASFKK